ncbi:MAG: hypothetical protein P8X79_19590 [Reinekea sp.]
MAQTIRPDSSNGWHWGEPMGAPAIFEKQIEIKLLHPASTEGVTDSGFILHSSDSRLFAGFYFRDT